VHGLAVILPSDPGSRLEITTDDQEIKAARSFRRKVEVGRRLLYEFLGFLRRL